MKYEVSQDRVVAVEDGEIVAEVDFPIQDGVAMIVHTFVDPSLRGQGVASELLQRAVDEIRSEGLSAYPVCSYAQSWFQEHPDQVADLLA